MERGGAPQHDADDQRSPLRGQPLGRERVPDPERQVPNRLGSGHVDPAHRPAQHIGRMVGQGWDGTAGHLDDGDASGAGLLHVPALRIAGEMNVRPFLQRPAGMDVA